MLKHDAATDTYTVQPGTRAVGPNETVEFVEADPDRVPDIDAAVLHVLDTIDQLGATEKLAPPILGQQS